MAGYSAMHQVVAPRCSLRLGSSRANLEAVGGGRTGALSLGNKWAGIAPGLKELRGTCRIATAGAARGRSSALTVQALTSSNLSGISALERVTVLAEALPYLQRFHNKTIVIKYGGAAMKDPSLKAGVVSDLVLLSLVGIRPVLVHGGGPEINTWLGKVGIEAKFKNGLRVTDEATMEVVEMVLVGNVNKSLVTLINQEGGTSVGLCGKDGQLIRARQTSNLDLGYVGEVTAIDPNIVKVLVDQDIIPVIASVAADPSGHALNINADTAAGEIAAALNAEKLVLMTDVPGILMDKDDTGTLVREADISNIRGMIQDGILAGGMIPKVECCVRSLAQGVRATHIIDGRQPHSLLQEILTDEGVGTMITG